MKIPFLASPTGILVALTLALVSREGWGEDGPQPIGPAVDEKSKQVEVSSTQPEVAPPATSGGDGELKSDYHAGDPANLYFSLSPGLLLWNDNAGASIDLVSAVRVSRTVPLYIGADVGYDYFRMNSSSGSGVRVSGIQLLPTVFYEFDMSHLSGFHPYLGASGGVNILYTSVTVKAEKATAMLPKGRDTAGEFLFRPGMRIDLVRGLSFTSEVRWGILKQDLLVCPQVGLAFTM